MTPPPEAARLRRLAAELRAEIERLDHTAAEATEAEAQLNRLEAHLTFRHRFRNLYLFDLNTDAVQRLLGSVPDTWDRTRTELNQFASAMEELANELDE